MHSDLGEEARSALKWTTLGLLAHSGPDTLLALSAIPLVRTTEAVAVSDLQRLFAGYGVCGRPAKSLMGIHETLERCGLLCTLMAKVELTAVFVKVEPDCLGGGWRRGL